MKNDLISIVVPCYNVENYLELCFSSLCNQTYSNIEVLLVNDGSTDGTEKIINDIVNKDERFKKINKKNGGLSSARNEGLKKCKGKYVCFVDSDDYVDENYVKKLYDSIIINDADIAVCDFWYFNDEKKWSTREKQNRLYTKNEALSDFLSCNQLLEVMTWNKLYKTKLFKDNNITFPDGMIHEDNFTTYKLFYYSKRISLISDKLYFYLQRNNSIMGVKFNKKRFNILKAVDETISFFKEKKEYEKYSDLLICYEANTYINLINNVLKSKYEEEEVNQLFDLIKSKKNIYLNNKIINKKIKIEIILFCYFKRLYSFLLRKVWR